MSADPKDAANHPTAQRSWLALLRGQVVPETRLTESQWAGLADEAIRHQLCGVTYRHLMDGPLAPHVPPRIKDRLRAVYLDTATRNALAFRQARQFVTELAARDIPVLLLKGVHLARFVYAEPGLRGMADVDIMVPQERLAEVEAVFLERGFGPLPRAAIAERCAWSNHLAKLEKAGAAVVEVHWSIERPTSPFRIDLDGLWQRSREATLEGVPVRLLAPEDLLLHLALHLSYHHRFERAALKGLMDIATVIAAQGSELDWRVMAARANDWGASGYLYVTLRLAEDLLGATVPASLFQRLARQPADEEVVDVARRYILALHAALPSVYLALAKSGSLRHRVGLLFRAVFLPREGMERIYGLRAGSPLLYPYYGLRLAGLLKRRGGLLLGTFLGSPAFQGTIDRDRDRSVLERWDAAPPR